MNKTTDLRGEKGRIQGDCVGHLAQRVVDEGGLEHPGPTVPTVRHDGNPLSATNYRRGFPGKRRPCFSMVEFGTSAPAKWRIEGPNVVSNRPSHLEAIHITKCRHPPQARLPLTDTRLYR
jgi:hypothetical protein